jgi:hypothetical protein
MSDGVRAVVEALMALKPNATIREMAVATGYSYVQVKKARSYLRNPERYRVSKRAHRRSKGVRPAEVVVAERRSEAAASALPVLELHDEGMSFSQIAKELGLTRHQVAGRIRRARIAGWKTEA